MTSIVRHRRPAFIKQQNHCYYCNFPMWEDSPESFAALYGITIAQARAFQCTAEHLHARCDGGADDASNIVAACLRCNRQRHQCKHPLDHHAYRKHVRDAIARGKWFPGFSRRLARTKVSVAG